MGKDRVAIEDVTYISEGDEFTLRVYKRQDVKVRRILLG